MVVLNGVICPWFAGSRRVPEASGERRRHAAVRHRGGGEDTDGTGEAGLFWAHPSTVVTVGLFQRNSECFMLRRTVILLHACFYFCGLLAFFCIQL